ncbi:MAG TPA: LptA/OstA family protein [Thermoanaerobaculia bacterium]|nr:LptA/OstA family protein [Thermoanaerobaculia bacterium]
MVRSVRILRIGLPIVFLAFIGVIALSFTENRRQGQAVTQPITSEIRKGDTPQLVAYAFEDVQTLGGRVVSRIRARRTMGFSSGWYTLEDVALTIFRPNGQSYELTAPQAEFRVETKEAQATGGVKITSSDGITIETATINFDGNRLVNNVPVAFSADAWSGRAGGVDLNIATERMILLEGVEAVMKPAGNDPAVTIRSAGADFDRMASEATFRDDVVLERQGDTLETASITARFDQEKNVLSGLEGCCGVEFALTGVSAGSETGPTVIRGERFFTEIGNGGEFRAIFIERGESPAMATMQGPPLRVLTAGSFRALLAGRGLTQLEATGSARLEERGAVRRVLSGFSMIAYFDAAGQRPSSAVVNGNLEYRDADARATAQKGTFDFVGDRIVLNSSQGALPSIQTDAQTVTAQTIEMRSKTGVVTAEGFVKAKLVNREGKPSVDAGALFPSSSTPVYVNSEKLTLHQQTGEGVFTGKVRAWQEKNILIADALRIEESGETVVASGNVRAVLYNAREGQTTAPITAVASTLSAKRNERRAVLEGSVRIEDQGRILTSDNAIFRFDTSQKLDRVEAEGNVKMAERALNREASGSKLVYRVTQKVINLEGSPAVVSEPRGTVKGEEIVLDLARNHVEVLKGSGRTEAVYRPESTPE